MDYEMHELVPVVGALAEKYTGHEHTSITYEKAEQLMEAVFYCIREAEKEGEGYGLKGERLTAPKTYEIGRHLVEKKIKDSLDLYNHIAATFYDYGNPNLRDVFLKDLPEFFRFYNHQFEPQNTIIILNYPVLKEGFEDTGVDKIWNFLVSVNLEQKFLHSFPKEELLHIFQKYDVAEEASTENLCEIILITVIMNVLLGKYLLDSHFTRAECSSLQGVFRTIETKDIEKQFQEIIQKLLDACCKGDIELKHYLCQNLGNMAVRVKNAVEHDNLAVYLKVGG